MSGLFVNDGSGYIHDCDEPGPPTPRASFTCPECEVTWFAKVRMEAWVWVNGETGRRKP
jgi:hypothetical protein